MVNSKIALQVTSAYIRKTEPVRARVDHSNTLNVKKWSTIALTGSTMYSLNFTCSTSSKVSVDFAAENRTVIILVSILPFAGEHS